MRTCSSAPTTTPTRNIANRTTESRRLQIAIRMEQSLNFSRKEPSKRKLLYRTDSFQIKDTEWESQVFSHKSDYTPDRERIKAEISRRPLHRSDRKRRMQTNSVRRDICTVYTGACWILSSGDFFTCAIFSHSVGHAAVTLRSSYLDTNAYRTRLRAFRALCLVPLFLDFSITVLSTCRRRSLETPGMSLPATWTMAE